MSFYTGPGQNTANVGNTLTGWFKNLFKAPKAPKVPTAQPNRFAPAGSPLSPYYQVGDDDTDLNSVANNLGVPLPQLVAANNGIKTLPPKGSYIQTQTEMQAQGVPPEIAAQIAARGIPGGGTSPDYFGEVNRMRGAQNSTSFKELNIQVQNMVAAGVLPDMVSVYTPIINPATGRPVTDAEMQANGYTYNPKTLQWKQGQAAATPAADQPDPYSEVKSIYVGKNRGYVTPEVANLLARKRRNKIEDKKKKVRKGGNQETASSVLNLNVGSG